MNEDEILVERTRDHVREAMTGESSGHDWWHVFRVYRTAMAIARAEGADATVVALAALLHDIADYKMHDGDTTAGPRAARAWLEAQGMDESRLAHICSIIEDLSFKGAGTPTPMQTLEGKIVQDADRLDAIGAIGIARAFAFGGSRGREIYNPDIEPVLHKSFDEYKASQSTSINHFYEKLLLLKDLMNTEAAKGMAAERHAFMLRYLEQFRKEWGGPAEPSSLTS